MSKTTRRFFLIFTATVLLSIFAVATWLKRPEEAVTTFSMPVNKKVIVIDPGHGGWDPGKTVGKILEKDINLQISLKLQQYLEMGGATVLLTRSEDKALDNEKTADLTKRVRIANAESVDLFISIHQNSFNDASVKGAQMFYYSGSETGKPLAQTLQKKISTTLSQSNNRPAKGSTDYFVLKNSAPPAVIIECGFLTNPQELKNLCDDTYQEKVAFAIYFGLIEYYAGEQTSAVSQ